MAINKIDESKTLLDPLSLRENFSWTFAGNVVYMASQWGILVMLAKLGNPAMIGQFALGLAICAPVVMFANLQLRAVLATDAKGNYNFRDYIGLRLITTTQAILIIAGIIIVLDYTMEKTLVILIIALAKSIESISDIFFGLFQKHERMERIAKSMMLKGPLSLIALGLGVYFTKSLIWGISALAGVWFLVLIGYDVKNVIMILKSLQAKDRSRLYSYDEIIRRELWPNWDIKKILQLAWLSLPLGFVMMLISLNSNIPRYIIDRFLGERELGIFAAMAYLMVAGRAIISSLGQSAISRLAKYFTDYNRKDFINLLLKLLAAGSLLGISGVIISILAGRKILTVIYRPEYGAQIDVFLILMVAASVSYIASLLGYGMTAVGYFRPQMFLFSFVSIVTFVTCYNFIPSLKLKGAAIAILITVIIQACGSLGLILHALSKSPT